MSHVPWYKRALPEQWMGLRAADWRRTQEATLFRSRNDPDISSHPADLFEDRAEQARIDPRAGSNLAQGRQTVDERQQAKREAMERAFGRGRTPTEDLPTRREDLEPLPGLRQPTQERQRPRESGIASRIPFAGAAQRLRDVGQEIGERASDIGGAIGRFTTVDPTDPIGTVLTNIDRPGGAVRAVLIEGDPRALVSGARDPAAFPGTDLPGVRNIENPLLRGAAGVAGEALLDPVDLVTGGLLAADVVRGGRKLVRGAARATQDVGARAARIGLPPAVEPAVRGVRDPLQTITGDLTLGTPEFNAGRTKITSFLDETERLAPTKAGEITEAQAGRFQSLEEARDEAARRGLEGEQALEFAARASETGRQFETVAAIPDLSVPERAAIADRLLRTADGIEIKQAQDALEQVFGEGRIEPAQSATLRRLLGIDAKPSNELIPRSFKEKVLDVLNLPRSILSAFDLSGGGRQGAILGARSPRIWAREWAPSIRALADPEVARQIDEVKWTGPLAEQRIGRVDRTVLDGPVSAREEDFISSLSSRIPGLAASQRQFVAFLNNLRADFFDEFAAGFNDQLRAGLLTEAEHSQILDDLGRFVNVATGRGELPAQSDLVRLASNLFFSPKLWKSRFDVMRMTLPGARLSGVESPQIRALARESMVDFVSRGTGVLLAGDLLGLWDVEVDPRSSDFGQIRIGPSRIDIWAGFRPIANLVARSVAKITPGVDTKKLTTGRTVDQSISDIITSHARTRLAPVPALGIDLLVGQDVVGEEVTALNSMLGLVTPLSVQDITEGVQEAGLKGGLLGAASLFGPGASAFLAPSERFELARSESVLQLPVELRGASTTFEELVQEVGRTRATELVETVDNPELAQLSEERMTDLMRRVREEQDPLALQQLTTIRAKEKLFKAVAESTSKGDYRLRAREIQAGARALREGLEEISGIERDPPDNPVDVAVEEWFQQFETCEVAGRTDAACMNREQAAFIERNGEDLYDKVLDSIYAATGDLPEIEIERRDVTKRLTKADFFDIEQDSWEEFTGLFPVETAGFETFVDWRLSEIRKLVKQFEGDPDDPDAFRLFDDPDIAFEFATNRFQSNKLAGIYSGIDRRRNGQWASANRELAQDAQRWAYLGVGFLNLASSGALQ